MPHWVRFTHNAATRFGTLAGDTIAVHDGDMFRTNKPTGATLKLADIT